MISNPIETQAKTAPETAWLDSEWWNGRRPEATVERWEADDIGYVHPSRLASAERELELTKAELTKRTTELEELRARFAEVRASWLAFNASYTAQEHFDAVDRMNTALDVDLELLAVLEESE